VFAQRLVGDGLGIDPTNEVLHAPCDGRVYPIAGASHAAVPSRGSCGRKAASQVA
jgi:phosphotransferase system IIA component